MTVPDGTAEGFAYAEIPDGGVTLEANTSYYILSDYYGSKDKFYAGGAATTTDAASIDGIVTWAGTGMNFTFHAASGTGWGPLDLKYTEEEEEVPPTEPSETEPEVSEPEESEPDESQPEESQPVEPAESEEKTLTTSIKIAGPGNVEGSDVSLTAGWAGMRITVGDKDIHVTALGRWYTPDSHKTHKIMITQGNGSLWADNKIVTVTAPDTPQEEGFIYAEIPDGGVTLRAHTSYRIISDYYGAKDKFYSASVATTTDAATIDGIVRSGFTAAPGTGWGPLDLKYTEVTETEEKPTVPPVEYEITDPEPVEGDKQMVRRLVYPGRGVRPQPGLRPGLL